MTANEQAPLHHEIILYATPDGAVRVEVLFEGESFWLSQKKMAELFGVESHTITYHLQEIYKSNELSDVATTRKIRVVQTEGVRTVAREVDFYNLDAIIAVGYCGPGLPRGGERTGGTAIPGLRHCAGLQFRERF
jgi:hypothetical protein